MNSSTYQQRIVHTLYVLSILYFSVPIYSLLALVYSHGTVDTSLIQSFLWIMSDALFLLMVMRMLKKNPSVVEALDLKLLTLIALFQFISVLTICILKQKNNLYRNTGDWINNVLKVSTSFAIYYFTYSTEQRIKTEMKKKEENGMELSVPLLEQKEPYVAGEEV